MGSRTRSGSVETERSGERAPEPLIAATGEAPADPFASERSGRPRRRGRRRGLLIVGLVILIGGAVAVGYSLYGLVLTDVIAHRAQDRLAADFAERLAVGDGVQREPPGTVEDDPADLDGFDDPEDVPVFVGTPISGPPPELLRELTEHDWVFEASPPAGQPVGRITIPKAGVDWIVVEGVRPRDLRMGPGHMRSTAMPGQLGNSVISGHRTTYGAPFGPLDLLEAGDAISIQTVTGTHTYEVVSTRIVFPNEMWVTEQWEGAWLTLTTCHPRFSSAQRLVVFAKLVAGPNAAILDSAFEVSYQPPRPPGA